MHNTCYTNTIHNFWFKGKWALIYISFCSLTKYNPWHTNLYCFLLVNHRITCQRSPVTFKFRRETSLHLIRTCQMSPVTFKIWKRDLAASLASHNRLEKELAASCDLLKHTSDNISRSEGRLSDQQRDLRSNADLIAKLNFQRRSLLKSLDRRPLHT